MRITGYAISFLTHDIVPLRYFEYEGELHTFMTVVKTRARAHSRELRPYGIGEGGIVVGEPLKHLTGIISAVPQRRSTGAT